MEFTKSRGKEGSWLDTLRQKKVNIQDKVGAAWIEVGRGWIGMYTHHRIEFGVGGWRALL